jgi:hypothetical protein
MDEQPVQQQPYNYVEIKQLSCSTTDASYEFERTPDEIILTNADSTNIAYVGFDQVVSATTGHPIMPKETVRFLLRARSVHAITSSSTATLGICALAYKDVRLKA